jgi:hypothetical protein
MLNPETTLRDVPAVSTRGNLLALEGDKGRPLQSGSNEPQKNPNLKKTK